MKPQVSALPRRAAKRRQVRSTPPIITSADRRRLGSVLTGHYGRHEPHAAWALGLRLDEAVYVEPEQVPASAVTMNSLVELVNLKTNECFVATLVYPDEAEFFENSISILEPLGMALLGSSAGSVVECLEGPRTASYKVASILYQPERGRDLHG